MRCPNCGRETPEAMLECRHCGGSTRPSILRRLFGWLRWPRVSVSVNVHDRLTPDEDPLGIEMPATTTKSISFTAGTMAFARGPEAMEMLSPEMREKVREMIAAAGGEVRYEKTVRDDGAGEVTVSESGTPLDPTLQAAIEKLLESETATREQRIVVETNGQRHVYESVDQMPPELRARLGNFADRPINDEEERR
jgi:hypothetical protein